MSSATVHQVLGWLSGYCGFDVVAECEAARKAGGLPSVLGLAPDCSLMWTFLGDVQWAFPWTKSAHGAGYWNGVRRELADAGIDELLATTPEEWRLRNV